MTEQLAVQLTLDIIYVYGEVNGAVAEFTLTAPGVWSAVVLKAEDGRYEVTITAYNSLGTLTTYSAVLYKLDGLMPLKTNWVALDYYNTIDLNRVEANTQYIAEYLTMVGYPVTLESTETGRDYKHIEFADDLNRVERNIHALTTGFLAPPGYVFPTVWIPLAPFDYRDANRLERNLQLLYTWAAGVVASFKRCGTFACGEEGEIY